MELTMSMFATQDDYWKARSGLHEGTVAEVANELNCPADNEVLLAEIAALKKDAERYRWLRHGDNDEPLLKFLLDARCGTDDVWLLRSEELDAAIDSALKTPNV